MVTLYIYVSSPMTYRFFYPHSIFNNHGHNSFFFLPTQLASPAWQDMDFGEESNWDDEALPLAEDEVEDWDQEGTTMRFAEEAGRQSNLWW